MFTVLILEDDRINLDVLGAVMRFHGYDVMQATTGEEAIALSKERSHIDLLICDVAVGVSSGTEVALKVCSIHADVLVLFISGTPMYAWEKRDVNNFLKLPLDSVDCLEKPLRPSALLAKANELLEKRAQRPRGRTAGGR